ncbi:MAG: NAD(P)-binding protein [Rhizobiaceae bacterium]|nr:NAD(P)-binding protein [Rhizobiaceae bacterium]MCV0407246.1 NAD(P)-binding protein [Rhizobiaceae bacterium]
MPKDERRLGLFSPGRIGPLALANRVIMAPMTTRLADAKGFVTAEGEAYYRARAAGGVGLVTVEMAAPEQAGKHRQFELGIFDDRFLPGLSRLVSTIHMEGVKAAIQLGHGGGHTRIDICGETPIAPSAIPHTVQEGHTEVIVPEAMSRERIARTVWAFAEAADRAARAGFDAVEIHGAHGYLLSQFMSPLENRRDDEYGGRLENRARFAIEITRAVRETVPDLGVIFRMNGNDFFEGGITPAEAVSIAGWAAEAGADAIHVTGGHYRSQPNAAIMIPPMATSPTPFLNLARLVKTAVPVPVITVGLFGDPTAAAAAVAAGDADFIALGRPLLADPNWARKASEGREVRRCLACNSCVDGMRTGDRLRCIVNPKTGREATAETAPLRSGQRIAVIGAGPAGLAYAAEMAMANEVTLFEKRAEVGGALRLAGLAPLFQGVEASVESLVDHAEAQLRRCRERGVSVCLRTDALRDPNRLTGFDHIVVATGAQHRAGTGPLLEGLLRSGLTRRSPFAGLARQPRFRDWFYFHARQATGPSVAARLRVHGLSVEVIGDAARPGKTGAAIASAYTAAYGLAISEE